MANAISAVSTRATGATSHAPVVPFAAISRRPAQLETLRDQLFREGQLDLAVKVAEKVAKLKPSRSNYFRLGFLYRESGRYREALGILRDALRFVDGPAYVIPEIHLHLAFTWFLLGKRKRMGEALRRAYATRWKPRSMPKFHMALGTDHFERRRYREAAQEYARAEAASKTPIERGRNAKNQAIAYYRLGDLKQAQVHVDRALRLHKRHGHPLELAASRTIRAAVCFEQGQIQRGLGILERAAGTFHRFGKKDREAEALMNAGYFAGEIGQWTQSRTLLDRALKVAAESQRSIVTAAYACRATASAAEDHFDQAQRDIGRAKAELRGRRDWFGTTHLCRAEGRIARLLGSWKDVRRAAKLGERHAAKAGDIYRVMEFRKMRAEAEKELGRPKAYESAVQGLSRLKTLVETPSPESRRAARTADRLAASNLPILIAGESDTGKLQLAREIHRASRRSKGPCIEVPCEQLVFPASDLGGHAEGAWSGAAKASVGMVRRAEHGTLILDRVDELDVPAQRLLVRIVDGRVRTVGDAEEKAVDVRIVATCHTPDRLVPELRNRLVGALIKVAPLRERPEEIEHVISDHLKGRRSITPDAVAELLRNPWNGNLTELRSVLDRLVAHSSVSIGRKLVLRHSRTPKSSPPACRVNRSRQLAAMASALS